jgi:integrase/recombinase XerD
VEALAALVRHHGHQRVDTVLPGPSPGLVSLALADDGGVVDLLADDGFVAARNLLAGLVPSPDHTVLARTIEGPRRDSCLRRLAVEFAPSDWTVSKDSFQESDLPESNFVVELALGEALPADRNPAATYLGRLSPGSRRTMRQALDVIAGVVSGGSDDATTLDWSSIRYQHAQAIRSALAVRYCIASSNKMLAALRGVVREAWRLGQVPAEDYARTVDVESVRGKALPSGRALAKGELAALMHACASDATAAGARDAALIAVAYGAGLRRAELTALDFADYEVASGTLTVRRGKGNRDRLGYATNGARAAVEDWLAVRSPDAGALFLRVDKAGRVHPGRMTGQAVLYILRKRAAQAGVAAFSPHDLRRSFVGELLDADADLSMVQLLAGHASVTTTTRYDRRGEQGKQRAAELLHIPYVARRLTTWSQSGGCRRRASARRRVVP